MPRRAKARRQTLQPGVQKHKIQSKQVDKDGIFHLLEQCVPQGYLDTFFNFAENCFKFYTKVACKLYVVPYSIFNDGKLGKDSREKLRIHYSVLVLLVVSMIHKFVIFITRVGSGHLDTTTFICSATFVLSGGI